MEEYIGQKDYYGYIYLTLDQKTGKVYVGQKKGLVEKTKNYYGSGSIIENIKKKRGTHFLKKTILGICYSKEESDIAETECIYFFRSFGSNGIQEDSVYGYNLMPSHTGGTNLNEALKGENHPRYKKVDIKKLIKLRKLLWSYEKIAEELNVSSCLVISRLNSVTGKDKKILDEINKKSLLKIKGKSIDVEKIIELRKDNHTLKEIGDKFNISESYVSTIIKENNIKIEVNWYNRKKRIVGGYIPINIEKAIELRKKRWSYVKIGEEFNVTWSTIRNRLKDIPEIQGIKYDRSGITSKGIKFSHYIEIDTEKLIKLRKQGLTQKEIAKELEVCIKTIQDRLKEIPEVSFINVNKVEVNTEKLIKLREKGWSTRRIANELNVHKSTIQNRLKKFTNLQNIKLQSGKKKIDINIKKAIELRKRGYSYTKIGKEFGVSYHTIRDRLMEFIKNNPEYKQIKVKHTKESKKKISEANSGNRHTEETKKKISILKKGKRLKYRRDVNMYKLIELKIKGMTYKEIAEELCISKSTVQRRFADLKDNKNTHLK